MASLSCQTQTSSVFTLLVDIPISLSHLKISRPWSMTSEWTTSSLTSDLPPWDQAEQEERTQRVYLLHNVLQAHAHPAIWQKFKARQFWEESAFKRSTKKAHKGGGLDKERGPLHQRHDHHPILWVGPLVPGDHDQAGSDCQRTWQRGQET